jgi:hypothetical protein
MRKLDLGEKEFLYIMSDGESRYKIGWSKDPWNRLKQLQTGNPKRLFIEHVIECTIYPAAFLEKRILSWFGRRGLKGEWRPLTLEHISWLKSLKNEIGRFNKSTASAVEPRKNPFGFTPSTFSTI